MNQIEALDATQMAGSQCQFNKATYGVLREKQKVFIIH